MAHVTRPHPRKKHKKMIVRAVRAKPTMRPSFFVFALSSHSTNADPDNDGDTDAPTGGAGDSDDDSDDDSGAASGT
jgi:hypothetical protein